MPSPCPKPEPTPKKVQQPLKRAPIKKKAKAIKRFSSRRMIQNEEYKVARMEYLEDHKVCEVKGCMHPANQIHHRKGRIEKLLTDKRYFLAVCEYCHGEIELKPLWAKKMGYSLNRL